MRSPSVGDKLKVLAGSHHPSRIGTIGKIISVDRGLYEVDFGKYKWWMDESEFEQVESSYEDHRRYEEKDFELQIN